MFTEIGFNEIKIAVTVAEKIGNVSYPILISSFGFLVNFSVIFLLLLIGDLARLTSVFDPVFRDHAIKLFCRH